MTEITYNGNTIATIEDGQTATLACAEKLAASDIVIAVGADCTIAYNGIEVVAYEGKTVTLVCNGKNMATDVVVTIGTPTQGVRLVTSDGEVITDTNGLRITTLEV